MEDDELQNFPGLENLCERIIEDVKENGDVWAGEDGKNLDPEDADFYIQLPEEIYEEVQEEWQKSCEKTSALQQKKVLNRYCVIHAVPGYII